MILLLLSLAFAGEHNIDPSTLPAAISAAVQTRLPGAVIVAAEKEGRAYEAKVTLGERHLELAFLADGTWLEEEERIAPDSLAEAVLRSGEHGVEVQLTEAGAVGKVEHLRDEEEDDDEDDDHG